MRSPRPVPLAVVFGLFLLSGATGLVYEVVWLRQLILIFGSTLHATSTILSTFMGGLALGAFVGGRLLQRTRWQPLLIYGWIEIAIGGYALLVPALFGLLTGPLRAIWAAGGSENFVLLSLAKFVGTAIVLLPPTVLMGASLPVLARQVADDPGRIGGKVGTLYAINTFGAVLGTTYAGFLAIPTLGVRTTLWSTAAINVALGGIAIWLSRGAPLPAALAPREETVTDAPRPRGSRIVLVAFAASGFSAMVLEVAWTRGLVLVLGSSVYAFALMLVAFLVGLAAGSAFFAGVLKRRPTLDSGLLLAGLLAAAGALAYGSSFVFQTLPRLFAEIHFSWHPSPTGWFVIQLGFALLVMFPATFALGGIFPTVLQMHARGLDTVGRAVGAVYAANTSGTILGAALAGFLLLPAIGVRDTVLAIAIVEIGLAVLVVAAASRAAAARRAVFALACVGLALLVVVARPGWDSSLMNSGVYMNIHDLDDSEGWEAFLESVRQQQIVYLKEGLTASVLVADQPEYDNRYLAVNGKVEASTNADMETQLLCAHLPLLLHPDPRDVLVIGLASGITVGGAATHPLDTIRVVEVEKAIIPAAHLFAESNGNVLEDTRVELSINDARNELEFSERTYDVIISEPSNPWMTVASNLFTEEFFELASSRLRDDGVFSQWLQNYYLPTEELRSIVHGFHRSFPYVYVFQTFEGVDLLMLGSKRPLSLDLSAMDRRISELKVRMDLARVGVSSPFDILPLLVLGPEQVAGFVDGAPRNTDDNARVEFAAPKSLGRATIDENLEALRPFLADPLEVVIPPAADAAERDDRRLRLARGLIKRGLKRKARALLATCETEPCRTEGLALLPEPEAAETG